MSWSATQYTTFEDERTRPVRDLVAAVPTAEVRAAVDLGCGPGNSTEVLAARYPNAAITGIDSSPDMIAAARERLPRLRFDLASIETWDAAGPFDVMLANASLQWVPHHDALFPRLTAHLSHGGSLCVQMPDNLDEPAHQLMRETATDPRWAAKLAGAAGSRAPRQSARWYYDLLRSSCARVDVWRTTYFHVLKGGPQAVVDWFRSTGLRPFLAPLTEAERAEYLARYLADIAKAYPALPDGTVLLPFPRLFMVATR